ncbi:plasmid partitioning/stability family protein [Klebsiella aerogenes]|uniref:plasmid partitioning/stability family protein n=1 Tax=Klebsiella aerogenes TaxID=548 RepID=UPI00351CCAD6
MGASMNRRKVLIYLRPETHASERVADARIEGHHIGNRGEFSRTALLAGIALGEIDTCLPSLMAALLTDNTSPETLRTMLASFLGLPAQVHQPVIAPTAAPPKPLTGQPQAGCSAASLAGILPE